MGMREAASPLDDSSQHSFTDMDGNLMGCMMVCYGYIGRDPGPISLV